MTLHPRHPVAHDQVRAQLTALVYELLDAHHDTAELIADAVAGRANLCWWAHLDYLRALQRTGREILAAIGAAPSGRGSS